MEVKWYLFCKRLVMSRIHGLGLFSLLSCKFCCYKNFRGFFIIGALWARANLCYLMCKRVSVFTPTGAVVDYCEDLTGSSLAHQVANYGVLVRTFKLRRITTFGVREFA